MPKQKLKTHKGAKRRFKVTAGGKVLQAKNGRGLKRNRAGRAQRAYGKMLATSPSNRSHFEAALPYDL